MHSSSPFYLPAFLPGLRGCMQSAWLGLVCSSDFSCNQNCRKEAREGLCDAEEVSEACSPHLEGSVTRSLLVGGRWTPLDASVSKELLAERPCPWLLPGALLGCAWGGSCTWEWDLGAAGSTTGGVASLERVHLQWGQCQLVWVMSESGARYTVLDSSSEWQGLQPRVWRSCSP